MSQLLQMPPESGVAKHDTETNAWFQLQWPVNMELTHIAAKEIPINIATLV